MGEKGEGIKEKTHSNRQQYGDYQSKWGLGETEEGKGTMNGDEKRLDLGW